MKIHRNFERVIRRYLKPATATQVNNSVGPAGDVISYPNIHQINISVPMYGRFSVINPDVDFAEDKKYMYMQRETWEDIGGLNLGDTIEQANVVYEIIGIDSDSMDVIELEVTGSD